MEAFMNLNPHVSLVIAQAWRHEKTDYLAGFASSPFCTSTA